MKISYIYHVQLGHNTDFLGENQDFFMYARNADTAKEFCKEKFGRQTYCYCKFIKVGETKNVQETQILSDFEADRLRKTQAVKSDIFSEQRAVESIT